MQRIYFLILPKVELLDLAGPAQVFDTARTYGAGYDLSYVGPNHSIKSAQSLGVHACGCLPTVKAGDLVVIPGMRDIATRRFDPAVLAWTRAAAAAKAHIASVCSGAFLLGSAGLLDGVRCTTHWSLTQLLSRRFPLAQVQEAALFVEDGRITTSAGIASGMDMALAIVERHCGPLLASKVARELVIYMRRDANQPQSSVFIDHRAHLDQGVHRVQDWLVSHFTKPVSLDRLGRIAGLSGRHLARQFKAATGLTPLGYQQRLRLELASTLLTNSKLTLEDIAERCGFEDSRSLRRLWSHRFGHSPSKTRAKNMTEKNTR